MSRRGITPVSTYNNNNGYNDDRDIISPVIKNNIALNNNKQINNIDELNVNNDRNIVVNTVDTKNNNIKKINNENNENLANVANIKNKDKNVVNMVATTDDEKKKAAYEDRSGILNASLTMSQEEKDKLAELPRISSLQSLSSYKKSIVKVHNTRATMEYTDTQGRKFVLQPMSKNDLIKFKNSHPMPMQSKAALLAEDKLHHKHQIKYIPSRTPKTHSNNNINNSSYTPKTTNTSYTSYTSHTPYSHTKK